MNLLLSQREQEVSVPDQGFTVVLTGPGDQHYAKWTPFIQCIRNQWPLKALFNIAQRSPIHAHIHTPMTAVSTVVKATASW